MKFVLYEVARKCINIVWKIMADIYIASLRMFGMFPEKQLDELKPAEKVVYLTFDDGPSLYTRTLLEILAEYNVKATFFVTGNGDSEIISEIVKEGHSIGNHTKTHKYANIYFSEENFFCELYEMENVIKEKAGVRTKLIRFPGGSSNTVSRFNPKIMTSLTELVQEKGYRYFDWNVNSGDAGKTKISGKVYKNIIEGIQTHDPAVVLQHDVKDYSVAVVRSVIVWGLRSGYTFLPLRENSPTVHHILNN